MRLVALMLPAVALLQGQAQQPDPRELLKESAAAIKRYRSYQLESMVAVEVHGGPLSEKLEMPSSISVKRPAKVRIVSNSNSNEVIIVGDGEHTWFYESVAKKYVKRDATEALDATVISAGLLPKNLPDLEQSIKSVKIQGEDTINIGGAKTQCWVVQTIFDKITLPEQGVIVHDAVQITWIAKDTKLTLRSTFGATIHLPSVDEPVEMSQSTNTTKLRLNIDLPDSMFVFSPPPGTKETEDWLLPGITKPDVTGKTAPAALLADRKGNVVLAYFTMDACVPCQRELPVIEKLKEEFRDQGLSVVVTQENYPELSLTSFPTIVLIDREGKIASYEVGARGESALRADLAKVGVVAKPSPF
jgi:outer membrane lipoprotein-sorting protein